MSLKQESLDILKKITEHKAVAIIDGQPEICQTKEHSSIPIEFCKKFIAPYSKDEAHKLLCEIFETYKRIGIMPYYHVKRSYWDN